jgi:Transposase DDE domain
VIAYRATLDVPREVVWFVAKLLAGERRWRGTPRGSRAAYGYSRDGRRGKAQIEYGLLTDFEGRPVAVRVFAGNTGDPKTFPEAVGAVRGRFGLRQMIMVGDRGMITSARIKDLRELAGMAWITCLRSPAIRKLMGDGGPLQRSLSDERDLAEITSPDYPDERLIACRNPFLAAERARNGTTSCRPPKTTWARSPPRLWPGG